MHSQRIHLYGREEKHGSEQSEACHFSNSDKVKHCTEHWKRFAFKSSELKQPSEHSQRFH